MKFRPHPALVIFAALVAIIATLPFITTANSRRDFYFFDVDLTSTTGGQTQLFFDVGRGTTESDSSVQPLKPSAKPARYRYMMPTGTVRGLRLDPADRAGTMTLSHAQIVDRSGHIIRAFRA